MGLLNGNFVKYFLGRGKENDFIIDDMSVSNKHASIEIVDDKYIISDLNSRNGTFINGVKIQKKVISLDDDIVLGNCEISNQALFSNINTFIKHNKIDFSKEFNELEAIYKDFIKKNSLIERNHRNKNIIIKLTLTLVLMGLCFLIFKNLVSSTIVGLVSGVLSNYLINNVTAKEKKEDILIEYTNLFQCPKCNTELISKSWKYWKNKKSCPNTNCNATWK